MTTRYVGPGGSDGNDGLTWANRKLTLNGVEDTPVVAGDDVYVGPGTYREQLTCDVSGSSGNLITYYADTTGENTDGVGGEVRVTGSDNDTTATRSNGFTTTNRSYRRFVGFRFDMTVAAAIERVNESGIQIEDCVFLFQGQAVRAIDTFDMPDGVIDWHIKRCVFIGSKWVSNERFISLGHTSLVRDQTMLIENCLFIGIPAAQAIIADRISGVTVKNCTFTSVQIGVQASNMTATEVLTVRNCHFIGVNTGLNGNVSGIIDEDYNNFQENLTDRTNVAVGSNSTATDPLLASPIMKDGYRFPMPLIYAELNPASSFAQKAGNSEATEDIFGIVRPTVSAKKSWGPAQFQPYEREASTVRTGSAAITLADAGDHAIFIPTDGSEITVDVYGRFETNYAGTKPQLIIRQPGAADSTDTMTGSADTWEQLSITITPNASPDYVVAIIRNLNTATSGSFAAFFDDLQVT